MLADKHTRNVRSLSAPSNHVARGVISQDALARTPLWSTMIKPYPSGNGHRDPKQANRNNSGQLALSPQVLICPPPLLGHDPMVTSLPHRREVIIRPMKDGDGKRRFELGPMVTMSCHQWNSNTKTDFFPLLIEQNTPNTPQQDSPVHSLPREQALRQPTPGTSGTGWSEELFRGKQQKFHFIFTFTFESS
ncbi:hypothetical protein O181_093703 [Austropuccinia psidii MF-1]|uniref:Uncharacterized protein n=1 Tax=Austropuccinia psidii MF-1 TaxID=1389203 RepID=A0A9Q3J0R7_9BASI|nr:hypothetical protein [Austropuccinia psidii MF-1]